MEECLELTKCSRMLALHVLQNVVMASDEGDAPKELMPRPVLGLVGVPDDVRWGQRSSHTSRGDHIHQLTDDVHQVRLLGVRKDTDRQCLAGVDETENIHCIVLADNLNIDERLHNQELVYLKGPIRC